MKRLRSSFVLRCVSLLDNRRILATLEAIDGPLVLTPKTTLVYVLLIFGFVRVPCGPREMNSLPIKTPRHHACEKMDNTCT